MKRVLFSFVLTFPLFSTAYLPAISAQSHTLFNLPESASLQLWKGRIHAIEYPQLLTIESCKSAWLLATDGGDRKTLASQGWDKPHRLLDVKAGYTREYSKDIDGTIHTRRAREGFICGIGIGLAMVSYTQSFVEYWGDAYGGPPLAGRGSDSALITDFRIGHGLTDQVLLYYTSRISWLPLRNFYRDTVITNGTAGLGLTIYPYYKSSLYIQGSVGLATLATWMPPLELERARPTGVAVSTGVGYEFFPHCSVELTVSFGNASRTKIDRVNHIELTNEVVSVLLTLNGLAY